MHCYSDVHTWGCSEQEGRISSSGCDTANFSYTDRVQSKGLVHCMGSAAQLAVLTTVVCTVHCPPEPIYKSAGSLLNRTLCAILCTSVWFMFVCVWFQIQTENTWIWIGFFFNYSPQPHITVLFLGTYTCVCIFVLLLWLTCKVCRDSPCNVHSNWSKTGLQMSPVIIHSVCP